MSEKEKIHPITLRPNPRMREMVEAIQREKGFKTLSDVFFYAVGEVYHKLFPVYATRRGGGASTEDPAEIGRRKVELKEGERKAREDIANEERANICRLVLKGEVVDDIDGKFCVFNTYQFDQADEQRVPLDMITDEFAKHQQVSPNQ